MVMEMIKYKRLIVVVSIGIMLNYAQGHNMYI